MMHEKIDNLNIPQAIEDVRPFVKDSTIFDFWTKDYFKLLTNNVLYLPKSERFD